MAHHFFFFFRERDWNQLFCISGTESVPYLKRFSVLFLYFLKRQELVFWKKGNFESGMAKKTQRWKKKNLSILHNLLAELDHEKNKLMNGLACFLLQYMRVRTNQREVKSMNAFIQWGIFEAVAWVLLIAFINFMMPRDQKK